MVKDVYTGFESGERMSGPWEADTMKHLNKLEVGELDNFRDTLEGKAQPINQKVRDAAIGVKKVLDDVMKSILDFNAEAKAKGEPGHHHSP